MKVFAVFALIATLVQGHQPAVLSVRGGASLGPLDGATALKLSKAATTAYVAGSASKYINSQTGGENSQVSFFSAAF